MDMSLDDILSADAEYVTVANHADQEREIEEYYLACWADEMDAREQYLMRMEVA